MIKKPEDLKNVFVDGAIPNQDDFRDLIDSFIPKDLLSDEDLRSLPGLIAWWRTQTVLPVAGPSTAPQLAPSAAAPTPVVPSPTTAVPASTTPQPATTPIPTIPQPAAADPHAPIVLSVAADGEWHALPISQATVGVWQCMATTLKARPGYRIINNTVAVVGTQLSARRLVQNVDRDSWLPWHTVQFAWQITGSHYQLQVRARAAFGPDINGGVTQIQCRLALQP